MLFRSRGEFRFQPGPIFGTLILADEINLGYAHLYNEGVTAVNGTTPLDMVDFVNRVLAATGVIEIQTSSGGVIMLDTMKNLRIVREQVIEKFGVPPSQVVDVLGREARFHETNAGCVDPLVLTEGAAVGDLGQNLVPIGLANTKLEVAVIQQQPGARDDRLSQAGKTRGDPFGRAGKIAGGNPERGARLECDRLALVEEIGRAHV